MHVKSEAVSSSRIEGTKTGINEALLEEADVSPEMRHDWQEVQNYIKAMNYAITELQTLPVALRLVAQTHQILLSSARGAQKEPGQIRTTQNWIGGSTIRTAHFIPPHHDEVPTLLADWEKFWHNKSLQVPVLIKVAIGHYQFETIHPFLDGNGRIGRLLITLQLIERGFLDKPVLYLSSYFEKYRQAYYDSLDEVRNKSHLEQWVRFFLEGVIITATKGKQTFEDIINLREHYEAKVSSLGRKVPRARQLLLYLFSHPVVSVNDVAKQLNMSYETANNLVADFERLSILSEMTGYSRNRLFRMNDYVALFQGL
jgi:Fic family protein